MQGFKVSTELVCKISAGPRAKNFGGVRETHEVTGSLLFHLSLTNRTNKHLRSQ